MAFKIASILAIRINTSSKNDFQAIRQMTCLCVCAHSGVLIARVYTHLGCPCIRVQLTRLSEQATRRPELRLVRVVEKCHTLSLPRCRFLVIASTLSLSGIFRDFNQHGGHVLLEIFCYFLLLFIFFCYFFISLLVGVLRISWISFQH